MAKLDSPAPEGLIVYWVDCMNDRLNVRQNGLDRSSRTLQLTYDRRRSRDGRTACATCTICKVENTVTHKRHKGPPPHETVLLRRPRDGVESQI